MPQTSCHTALCWFRRDLRSVDHAALYHALTSAQRVYCVFVFDTAILDALPGRYDRRVDFIWQSVAELKAALRALGGDLIVLHDRACDAVPRLAQAIGAEAVFCNRDYEPAAIGRDAQVAASLAAQGIDFRQYKDQVIVEQDELLTQAGKPFSVFTPYKNAWLKAFTTFHVKPYQIERFRQQLATDRAADMPSLESMGFAPTDLAALGVKAGMQGASAVFEEFQQRIGDYRTARDFPAIAGTSGLSPHLRFGTISIRHLAGYAWHFHGEGAQTWLSELIWRDFYQQILYHHPRVVGHSFKPDYDKLVFPDSPALFDAWCEGRTGYPLVDAAMRQLNHCGWMHNRLRMITASFLVKDLHVDWRLGEQYFANTLLDFDLASNNGGWQWAASTGCDAQPYFRIFNPVTQSEKFDPQGRFIRHHVAELTAVPQAYIHAPWTMPSALQQQCGVIIGRQYPAPLVDHATARAFTLALYGAARAAGG